MSDWTTNDIPDQTGRVFLITGANSGIGFEATRALVDSGAHVVMACRSRLKAEAAVAQIEAGGAAGSTEIVEMDLADLDSVRSGAEEFLAHHDRLDVLVNNAGLMAIPRRTTEQGLEMQFGVNHLAHFALTAHLLDALASSGTAERPSRVVTISSQAHRPGKIDFDNLDSSKGYSKWGAYCRSKLANLLFTRELEARCRIADLPVIAVAAHPGASDTNLGNEGDGGILSKITEVVQPIVKKLATQSAEMGALPTLRAATDPTAQGGDYYGPDGFGEQKGHPEKVGMSSKATDDAVARRLWDVSLDLAGVSYPF